MFVVFSPSELENQKIIPNFNDLPSPNTFKGFQHSEASDRTKQIYQGVRTRFKWVGQFTHNGQYP